MLFFPKDLIKFAALQVRSVPIGKPDQEKRPPLGKRVSVYTPLSLGAGLTIEAAFSLSLFLFAMVCLALPMKIMNTHRQMQTALESICEKASQYAYVKSKLEQGLDGKLDHTRAGGNGTASGKGDQTVVVPGSESGEGEHGWSKEYKQYFLDGAMRIYVKDQLAAYAGNGPVYDISMERSQVLTDGMTIDLVADYQVRLPFPLFKLSSIPQTVRSCRRAWIGSQERIDNSNKKEDDKDEMVFVGRGGTRFHKRRDCHYISNDLTAIAYHQLEEYRSQDGRRYNSCQVCAKKSSGDSVIYIMKSGKKYHTRTDCSAIISYVQVVPVREVEYLGACSYCSK